MKFRLPKNVWRLGVLTLALTASLTTARPAASCVDNPQCARDCDIICRWGCPNGCDPQTFDTCQQSCYNQCAGC